MADELRAAFEMATEEELQAMTELLFRKQLNPLDYVRLPDPIDIQSQSRADWMDALERRFRFLAADGLTVLKGKAEQIPYRDILIQVCRYLKIPFKKSFSTIDLEAEIFLHVLQRAWKQLPARERNQVTHGVQQSLARTTWIEQLPEAVQQNPVGLMLKGGSALVVSAVVRPLLLQQIARQFTLHFARYQVAQAALLQGGAVAATQLNHLLALQASGRGMLLSAARYGAMRTFLAVLGPALWMAFFADLGWRAIATNYGRIIPTIFALAQIRLTRTECWEAA